MQLSISQTKSEGVKIKTDEFGLIVILRQTSQSDHESLKAEFSKFGSNTLKTDNMCDIYYPWQMTSVFIFDTNGVGGLSKSMRGQIRNISYRFKAIVTYNGRYEKKGSSNDGSNFYASNDESDNLIIVANSKPLLTVELDTSDGIEYEVGVPDDANTPEEEEPKEISANEALSQLSPKTREIAKNLTADTEFNDVVFKRKKKRKHRR